MKRGDIYDARLSPTESSKQAGTRPVVIVNRDAINTNSSVIIIVPLTKASSISRTYPNNVTISKGEGGLMHESVLLGDKLEPSLNLAYCIHEGVYRP